MIDRGLARLASARRQPQGPAMLALGGGRTNGAFPMCGGLDPDRAFSVPHTAESARQTNASTTSARERAPQSGGVPISDDAPAGNWRSACSTGSMLPNFSGRADPDAQHSDEGVAPLATATGIPTPNGATAMNIQHPPTTATGISGTRPWPHLPGEGSRTSTDEPPDTLGATGAFMRYSRQEGGESTESPKMMRGSHALSGPSPNRVNNKRVPDGE